MWECTVRRPDGRTFTGYGLTNEQAEYRARRQAGEGRR
jgi:hypothetical protein